MSTICDECGSSIRGGKKEVESHQKKFHKEIICEECGVQVKGWQAYHDLAISQGNAGIHNILQASRVIKLTKIAAESYRIGMRNFHNKMNIRGELDYLVESYRQIHYGEILMDYLT